jgi:uncharacterized protein (TIGR02284 family)
LNLKELRREGGRGELARHQPTRAAAALTPDAASLIRATRKSCYQAGQIPHCAALHQDYVDQCGRATGDAQEISGGRGRIMGELIHSLKALHTSLIDSRSGYQEGLKDAQGQGLSPLFTDLIALHGRHADVIAAELKRLGAPSDDRGSYMGTLDRAVMKLSSLFTKLDEKFLPNLIDGEQRVLAHYDKAIRTSSPANAEYVVLIGQRDALLQRIAEMKAQAGISS